MRKTSRCLAVVGLLLTSPLAFADSITDTYSTGDRLTATILNTIKDAVNDNDSRATALEAADDDMNVRVGILESQNITRLRFGFTVPDNTMDSSNGHPLGTVYVRLGEDDVFVSTNDAIGGAVWAQLTPKRYAIGDVGPAGGWVFRVTADGLHGLEAAPADLADAAWGCDGTDITGAESTAIGTGKRNTDDMVRGCADAGTAARLADDYVSPGDYFDWYLPSLDELVLIYDNLGPASAANVGGFTGGLYWSSSEFGASGASLMNFDTGGQGSGGKTLLEGVRPVRAF